MDIAEFLDVVITSESGYFCLAVRNGDGEWYEDWYCWPKDKSKIITAALKYSVSQDVYFSSYLFSEQSSRKENVLPSRTIQADLDHADLLSIPIAPTVTIESSPGRYHAYWVVEDELLPIEHEQLSKKITYSIPNCDRSGWPLGRKLRLPDTYNYKYSPPVQVSVSGITLRRYTCTELESCCLPIEAIKPGGLDLSQEIENWVENPESGIDKNISPLELLHAIKTKLPPKVISQYNLVSKDRSTTLWALMTALFRADLSRELVFYIAKYSANNKFNELKYNGDRELAKDVLRAEAVINSPLSSVKQKILELRVSRGHSVEKRQAILDMVLNSLKESGEFMRTYDDSIWYIPANLGRPIQIGSRSEYLQMTMDLNYGLNNSEVEYSYVAAGLANYARSLSVISETGSLSYYNIAANTMFIHTGRREVVRITPQNIDKVVNGTYGLVFPWNQANESFSPRFDRPIDWAGEIFDGALDTVLNLSKEEAKVILQVWLMFVLFRTHAVSRPILALFGQPGCLDGNTILSIKRGEHSPRNFSIKHAYNSFHGRWNRNIPTRILSVKDNIVTWREIKNIIYSGNKPVYCVFIGDNDPVYTTADHRFLTPTGYKHLSELSAGDTVVTKGPSLESDWKIPSTRRIVTAKYHPYSRSKTVNGYGPYNTILYCRAVLEANLNNLSITGYLKLLNTNDQAFSIFKFLPENIHIHHINENPEDDSLDNLKAMTKSEHDTFHGLNNQKNLGPYSGLYTTTTARIKLIEYYGLAETYDIEMADPDAPNFVVNNIVVHNSGKSTLMRRIYTILYGGRRSLSAVTSAEDFDQAVAIDPLVVLDNVDTWERWLPDRLALAAATSDVTKRKLYTDFDTVTLRRQAILGISAHNPKFGREDVTDRLLLLMFKRLPHFIPEGDIIANLHKKRAAIWGSIITDIQKVLNTPLPTEDEIPQFRVEDFSRIGMRIARALGIDSIFFAAITKISSGQKTFSLEEDSILVQSLSNLLNKQQQQHPQKEPQWYTASALWSGLEISSPDPRAFIKIYRNSIVLGHKLWSMQENLKHVFNVEWKDDSSRGSRLWKFMRKEE